MTGIPILDKGALITATVSTLMYDHMIKLEDGSGKIYIGGGFAMSKTDIEENSLTTASTRSAVVPALSFGLILNLSENMVMDFGMVLQLMRQNHTYDYVSYSNIEGKASMSVNSTFIGIDYLF